MPSTLKASSSEDHNENVNSVVFLYMGFKTYLGLVRFRDNPYTANENTFFLFIMLVSVKQLKSKLMDSQLRFVDPDLTLIFFIVVLVYFVCNR